MAQTFINQMVNGGGRLEWIYFIHGLPWAVTSHADVLAALPTGSVVPAIQAYRKILFGNTTAAINPTIAVPCYDVPIFDILDPAIGPQTVQWDDSKGLTGGNWSVNIFREDLGYVWPHRTGIIEGLEGLDVIPSDDFDSSIAVAQLSRDLLYGGTSLFFKNDVGGKLVAKITANVGADTPTYIWLGSEVLIARTVPNDEGDGEFSTTVARRGYKTAKRDFFTEDYDGNNLLLSDAPMWGIPGMPSTLYAIPMDGDGNILDMDAGPVRFREGKTMPSSINKDGSRKVSVHHAKKWFDYQVESNYAQATIGGFTLCHTSATAEGNDQAPHLMLREWDGAYVLKDVWLCAPGESIHFDTYTELCDAVTVEMIEAFSGPTANGTEQLANTWICDYEFGPTQLTNVTIFGSMEGPLPHLLGWGAITLTKAPSKIEDLQIADPYYNHREACEESLNSTSDNYKLETRAGTSFDLTWPFIMSAFRSTYILQYGWNLDDAADVQIDLGTAHTIDFPVPKDTSDGSHRIYLSPSFDATDFANDAAVRIGTADAVDSNDNMLLGKAVVDDTGDNYLEIKGAGGGFEFDLDVEGSTIPSVRSFNETLGPWNRGFNFFYMSSVNGIGENHADPWPVMEQMYVEDVDPVKLFRGLLGATTDAAVIPAKFTLTHIPNMWDDTDDWKDGVNWDQLRVLAQNTMEGIAVKYSLVFDKDFNFGKLWLEFLKLHQIAEVWEYNDAIRGWQIGFRRLGVVNATEAALGNRVVDASVRAAGASPTDVTSDTWLFGKIEASFHYSDAAGKFKVQINADDKSGRGVGGGADSTLKIKDKLTKLEDLTEIESNPALLDALRQHFGAMLKKVNRAMPEQKVKCTTNAIAKLAVGRECLVTDETARNPYTGALGLTKQACLVTKQTIRIAETRADVDISYRFSPFVTRAISPAIYMDAGELSLAGTTLTIEMAHSTPGTQNDFADPNGGMTDLEFFDCYRWNASTDEVVLDSACGCGDYAVQIFDVDQTTYDKVTPNRNHWTGTITVSASDKAVLTLDNADDFSDATDKIMIFNTYDNCETCQQAYLFFADSDSEVGAADIVGSRWV